MLSEVTNNDLSLGGMASQGPLVASAEIATPSSGRTFVGAVVAVILVVIGWSVVTGADGSDGTGPIDPNNALSGQEIDDLERQAVADQLLNGQNSEDAVVDGTAPSAGEMNPAQVRDAAEAEFHADSNQSVDAGQPPVDHDVALPGAFALVDAEDQRAEPSVAFGFDFALLVRTDEGWLVVDPQTGESQAFSSELVSVQFVTDTYLVGRGDTGLLALPIADLRATPVLLDLDTGGAEVWRTEDPDRVRVGVWHSEGQSEFFYDLRTGEGTSIEAANPVALKQRVGTSNLVSSRGSGVFEEADGTYRRISDGWGIAANRDEVLVHRCDAQLRCENVWLDRTSGEPLGHPSPEIDGLGLWGVGISDDGRWLFEAVNGPLEISEIKTGRQIDLGRFEIPWGDPGREQRFDLSSDGVWLVFASPLGETVLVNLDTGTDYRLLGDDRVQAVFVLPRSSLS